MSWFKVAQQAFEYGKLHPNSDINDIYKLFEIDGSKFKNHIFVLSTYRGYWSDNKCVVLLMTTEEYDWLEEHDPIICLGIDNIPGASEPVRKPWTKFCRQIMENPLDIALQLSPLNPVESSKFYLYDVLNKHVYNYMKAKQDIKYDSNHNIIPFEHNSKPVLLTNKID